MLLHKDLYPEAVHYRLGTTIALAVARGTTTWTGRSTGALRGGTYWLNL